MVEIYKCNICGNVVRMLHKGKGTLVCCGERMQLLEEKTNEVGKEKHVPVIEKIENGIKVKVGSIPHPMEEKHYIEFIEVIANGKVFINFLKPGEKPEAVFILPEVKEITVREYCNLHGLWKANYK